jgi:hypothetical protein
VSVGIDLLTASSSTWLAALVAVGSIAAVALFAFSPGLRLSLIRTAN